MALTEIAVRKARPAEKPYKLADSGGLYLYVAPTGFRSWRLKYRFGGKERRLVFGGYPEVTLAEARDRRDAARRILRDDRDPGVEREKARAAAIASAATTFQSVAQRWHAAQLERWSPRYARLIMFALERDVFPRIGRLPIREVTGPIVLGALRAIEHRGAVETAHRIRQQISAVLVFAISEGLVDSDVSATLGKALRKAPAPRRYQAITDLGELREFVQAFEAADDVGAIVRCASRLLALTAVRPGVLARATWEEIEDIDWADELRGPFLPAWRISAERMKLDVDRKADTTFEHVVPLSWQAVELLRALRPLTRRSPYLFPSAHDGQRPMSGDAIRMAYRRLGYGDRHVPHGWRAAFSTVMNDRARRAKRAGDRQLIDLMLAHVPEGMSASELRYNRLEHAADFRRLSQEWADALLAGQRPAAELPYLAG